MVLFIYISFLKHSSNATSNYLLNELNNQFPNWQRKSWSTSSLEIRFSWICSRSRLIKTSSHSIMERRKEWDNIVLSNIIKALLLYLYITVQLFERKENIVFYFSAVPGRKSCIWKSVPHVSRSSSPHVQYTYTLDHQCKVNMWGKIRHFTVLYLQSRSKIHSVREDLNVK